MNYPLFLSFTLYTIILMIFMDTRVLNEMTIVKVTIGMTILFLVQSPQCSFPWFSKLLVFYISSWMFYNCKRNDKGEKIPVMAEILILVPLQVTSGLIGFFS